MNKDTLIVTGSMGRIGKIICNYLRDEYEIIEIDLNASNEVNCHKVDISDFDALKKTFDQIGTVSSVIHLAAVSNPNASWSEVIKNNIIATRNIFECSKLFNVPKVILASTCHTMGGYSLFSSEQRPSFFTKKIKIDLPVRPNGDYASSKVFAETLARQYYEQHGIHSICLRIGFFCKKETTSKIRNSFLKSIWLSHRDMIQLFNKSLQTNAGFGIYFGVSKNKHRIFDLSKARKEIGFKPQDGLG